jgi:hypothetical protein
LVFISARDSSRGSVEAGCVLTVSVRGGVTGRGLTEGEVEVTPEFVELLITGDFSVTRAAVSFFGVTTVGLGLSVTRATVSDGARFLFLTDSSTGSVFFTPAGAAGDSGLAEFVTEAEVCDEGFVFIAEPDVTVLGSVLL